MQRREKRPTPASGLSLEELLQADPQSLRMRGRHPITRPDSLDADAPVEESLDPRAGVTPRYGLVARPDPETLDEVAGEVMRDIAELQDRVGGRLAAEEAAPRRRERLRKLVGRGPRDE